MTTPKFTPQQIEGAICHGMRGDRRRYELESADAIQKSATYGNNLAHYINVVQRCLGEATTCKPPKSRGVLTPRPSRASASVTAQDRITGDFGDFIKYGLPRKLSEGRMGCYAFSSKKYGTRTFFVVNPDPQIVARLIRFADRWREHARLIFRDDNV